MHEIDGAIVQGGTVVLSHLPFPDGQRLRILVVEAGATPPLSIQVVRQMLRNGVEQFDDPFAPMLPADQWEMLK
jgi:hypothetical protein